jgi:hypothetical protein
MKLLIQRVRPDEPFLMPVRHFEHFTIHLSRPMILRPGCVGLAMTNVALAVPPETLAILHPLDEIVQKRGIFMTMKVVSYFDTEEITIPVRNLTDGTVTLKSGLELLEMALAASAACLAEPQLVLRMPSR